jgi:hypothetical protein
MEMIVSEAIISSGSGLSAAFLLTARCGRFALHSDWIGRRRPGPVGGVEFEPRFEVADLGFEVGDSLLHGEEQRRDRCVSVLHTTPGMKCVDLQRQSEEWALLSPSSGAELDTGDSPREATLQVEEEGLGLEPRIESEPIK